MRSTGGAKRGRKKGGGRVSKTLGKTSRKGPATKAMNKKGSTNKNNSIHEVRFSEKSTCNSILLMCTFTSRC